MLYVTRFLIKVHYLDRAVPVPGSETEFKIVTACFGNNQIMCTHHNYQNMKLFYISENYKHHKYMLNVLPQCFQICSHTSLCVELRDNASPRNACSDRNTVVGMQSIIRDRHAQKYIIIII